jgi:ribosomal protein S18 acetylase RimI-like enzyme
VPVWRAEPHEAEVVGELLAAFRDHYGRDWPSDNAMIATVERLIEQPDVDFLLASADDDSPPAAVCQLRYRLSVWTGTDDCWLEDLFVTETARGTRHGRELVEAAFESARTRGCRRIELDVNEQNTAALRFYESLGFTTEPKPPGRTLFISRPL